MARNSLGLKRCATPTNSIAVIADTGPIVFEEGDVRTAVIADTLGGGAPFGITILEEE